LSYGPPLNLLDLLLAALVRHSILCGFCAGFGFKLFQLLQTLQLVLPSRDCIAPEHCV